MKRDLIELLIICVIVSVIGYYLKIDSNIVTFVLCLVVIFHGSNRKDKEDDNEEV